MTRTLSLLLAALLSAALAAAQDASRLEADGKKAFDSGRFTAAGEKYAAAAEASGVTTDKSADLHLQSAWSYFIAGNSKSAREQLKLALTARPDLKVVPDFYSPDFANLAASVRSEVAAPSVPPVDVEELKRSARAKLADGKAEDVVYDLKRAAGSTDPEVFRILADAQDRLGHSAEADAARRRASDLERGLVSSAPIGGPLDAGTAAAAGSSGTPAAAAAAGPMLDSAERSLASGDFRAAASYARQATEADPRNAEAHRIAGEAALLGGQEGEAEREFTSALALDSQNAKAQLGLGRVTEAQKKWNTSASHYRRALELDPTSVVAARGLGRSMSALGDTSAARLAFGRAIEIDPISAPAHNDFGVFLYRSNELDKSVEQLIEAVRLETSHPVYHENLGRAYRKKGMLKEAERELSEATRLAPNEAAAWVALGQVRAELKKPEEAATAYATALSLDPLSEEAATGESAVLASAGKLADAEAALLKAIENNAKSPALWNNLGVVRTQRSNYPGALDAFGKALAVDSSFEPAKANQARAAELAALEKAAS
ncbi:MAG TPA: tetratricopeptide repeat protein [Thermoanaerobaculia bacterium]|jgi:tetratricopeptide (TPR) repeat protein